MSFNRVLPVLLALLLVACGQRGPLYLPEEEPASGSETASEAEATGTTEDAGEASGEAAEAEPEPGAEAADENDENDENDDDKG